MQLDHEYKQLSDLSADERARRLPMLVRRLLERDGYEPRLQARGASPRDADVIASSLDEDLLVEVKSGARPAGLPIVDDVLVRLGRMPGHVNGLIVSRAGFSRGAIRAVAARRERVVLLVDGNELTDLFAGRLTLRSILRAKRVALVRDAEVPFFGGRTPLELPGPNDWHPLPRPNVRLPRGPEPWITAFGRGGDFVFANELPDVDWTVALGAGAGLDVEIPIRSLADLAGVFEVLRRGGWITASGRYSIHQTEVSWHGAGAAEFLDALRHQAARYELLPTLRMHGEEQAIYVDVYGGGLYSLTLRVVSGTTPWIFQMDLSLQLPGIPLDVSALRMTMRALDVEDRAAFRSLSGDHRVDPVGFHHGDLPLEPLIELVAEEPTTGPQDTWIRGVVIPNPFREESVSARLSADLRHAMGSTDKLVCSLGSWYTADERRDLHLARLEAVRTASVWVVRPLATWWTGSSRPSGTR